MGEKGRYEDETQHEVTLTKDFYLAKHAVTVGQWKAFQSATHHDSDAGKKPSFDQDDDHPVVSVSWDDAQAFLKWLGKKDGREYRLPTEAEWEYACRAGTKTAYSFGDEITSGDANFGNNRGTKKVGSYKANAYGLFDMHGNVYQWCSDWYGDYPNGSVKDPSGAASGSYRVYRGGSWDTDAVDCRSAFRGWSSPDFRHISDLGFRVAGPVGE